jgi:hypothetical protein
LYQGASLLAPNDEQKKIGALAPDSIKKARKGTASAAPKAES